MPADPRAKAFLSPSGAPSAARSGRPRAARVQMNADKLLYLYEIDQTPFN